MSLSLSLSLSSFSLSLYYIFMQTFSIQILTKDIYQDQLFPATAGGFLLSQRFPQDYLSNYLLGKNPNLFSNAMYIDHKLP